MNQEELIAEMVKEDLIQKALAAKLEREARQSEPPLTVYLDGGIVPEDVVI